MAIAFQRMMLFELTITRVRRLCGCGNGVDVRRIGGEGLAHPRGVGIVMHAPQQRRRGLGALLVDERIEGVKPVLGRFGWFV